MLFARSNLKNIPLFSIAAARGQFLCTAFTLTSKACSPILVWHYLQIGSPVHQSRFPRAPKYVPPYTKWRSLSSKQPLKRQLGHSQRVHILQCLTTWKTTQKKAVLAQSFLTFSSQMAKFGVQHSTSYQMIPGLVCPVKMIPGQV